MPILRVTDDDVLGYEDYGSGPLVLLIHGSPGSGRAWQRVGEQLASRFRVVAPNLPGYGETTSAISRGRADNSYAAELIEALVEEVGLRSSSSATRTAAWWRSGSPCAGRSGPRPSRS